MLRSAAAFVVLVPACLWAATGNPAETVVFPVRVTDAASGKPIAAAEVDADTLRKGEPFALHLRTDDHGEVSIPVTEDALVLDLHIRAPDHVAQRELLHIENTGDDSLQAMLTRMRGRTYALTRGVAIGGVVRDEHGRPVANATVYVDANDEAHNEVDSVPCPTDAEGRWHARAMEKPRWIDVWIRHPEYIPEPLALPLEGEARESLYRQSLVSVLRKGAPLEGTVVDDTGKPVAGAKLLAGEDDNGSNVHLPSAVTDAKGDFVFPQLPAGAATVSIWANDYAPQLLHLSVSSGAGAAPIRLSRGSTLTFHFVDRHNVPLAGATLELDAIESVRTVHWSAKVDAQGTAQFPHAPDVELHFYLQGDDLPLTDLTVKPGEREIVKTVSRALIVTGRVTDAVTRKPVPRFHLKTGSRILRTVNPDLPPQPEYQFNPYDDQTSTTGKYRKKFLQTADVNVFTIEADGYEPFYSRELEKDAGTVTLDIQMTPKRPSK